MLISCKLFMPELERHKMASKKEQRKDAYGTATDPHADLAELLLCSLTKQPMS